MLSPGEDSGTGLIGRRSVGPDRSAGRGVAAVLLAAALLVGCSRTVEEGSTHSVVVETVDFRVPVAGKGLVLPLNETTVTSPLSRRIASIVPDGSLVAKGDVLFELDPEGLDQKIRRHKNGLAVAEAEFDRGEATAARELNDAENRVAHAKLTLDVAQAELANAKAGLLIPESEKIRAKAEVKRGEVDVQDETKRLAVVKELRDSGLEGEQSFEHQRVTKELAEVKQDKADAVMDEIREGPTYDLIRQFELEVELAEFRLIQAKKHFQRTTDRNTRTLRHYKSRINRAGRLLRLAQKELADCVVRSPAPGTALAKRQYDRKFVAGMYAHRREEIMSLPDLSCMKVLTMVEESRISEVKVGQPARIRPAGGESSWFPAKVLKVDSLPKEVFNGLTTDKLHWVARPERRVFEVHLKALEQHDRLRAGTRVDVAMEVDRLPGSTVIPQNAIHRQGDEAFVWRLIDGTQSRTTVQLGPRDETHVVVTSGLAAGDRVLLRSE